MDSPQARIDSDGAKTGMKIAAAIQTMKNIKVGRHPKRSWEYALTRSPPSCPTSDEFDNPDCHDAGIDFSPVFGLAIPKRSLNCVCP